MKCTIATADRRFLLLVVGAFVFAASAVRTNFIFVRSLFCNTLSLFYVSTKTSSEFQIEQKHTNKQATF